MKPASSELKIADHFEPVPPIKCPVCGNPLSQWKGGEASGEGLLWKEHAPEPSLELLPKDQRSDDRLRQLRLEKDFTMATTCAHCKDGALEVKAVGEVKDGVWIDCEIVQVVDKRSGNVIYSKFA